MKYGLSNKQIDNIKSILANYHEITQAVIFGSRAMGNFKKASDIDVAIKGDNITIKTVARLKDDFEESYIPFFFDVVDYNSIDSQELKQHIDTKGKVFYIQGEIL